MIRSRIQMAGLCLIGLTLIALLTAACSSDAKNAPSPGVPDLPTPSPSATLTPAPVPTQIKDTHTPSPTPTASPTLTPTATPTATPTPTPSPTPTPTPLPHARLQLGRVLHAQGDYAAAIAQFQALLADPHATPDDAAEAQYRLGQCHWLNDDPAAAATAFQGFIDAHPDDPRVPAARFQLAEAHAAQEEWEAAIENYRAYLTERDVIASTVHERIGDAYVQLSDDQPALESYRVALDSAPYLDQILALRKKIADLHLGNESYDLAIAQYQEILTATPADADRAEVTYLLGQAHLLAGDASAAYRRWQTAIDLYPEFHHAYLSLVALVEAGVQVDEFQRGVVDFNAGVYGPAVQAFYRYLESDTTERRDEARYYIGRAYHLSGSYSLAINEYDTLIAAYPDSPIAADAWLEKARSLAAQGPNDEAAATLEAFVKTHPDHELAPTALWRLAQLHEGSAAWAEAAATYRHLQQNYPASERAAEGLFRAGLDHFRLKDCQAAVSDWQTLATDYTSSDRLVAAQYWLGKAFIALDDRAQAENWLKAAAATSAFTPDYYALRASHLLETLASTNPGSPGNDWPLAQPSLLLDFQETTARAQAEAWLLSWADPEGVIDNLDTLEGSLAQDPRYQRGIEFLAVGLGQAAASEFEILRQAQRDDPLIMYGLALASREQGMYKTSIRCALRVVGLSPVRAVGDAPRFLQLLAYPAYFEDLVLAEAATNNLDPLLVFALIRQESLFEAGVRSYAGATGLMQIMPSTGEWIALRLGWVGFAPNHLTHPYLNVHFGTWFFFQALNTFQGNVFAALAAYNAGIAAPERWLETAGNDPDLFVETIDYSQTANYVRLIYAHHALYRQIYQPGSP